MNTTVAALPEHLAEYGCRKLRISDGTLDNMDLDKKCPLDDGHLARQSPEETPSARRQSRERQRRNSSAGTSPIEMLPVELINMIIAALDIPTIVEVRRVSRRIMAAVDALRPYQMMRKHCPDILRAAIGIDARGYSITTLYETLQTTTCTGCGDRGSLDSDRYSGPEPIPPEELPGLLLNPPPQRLAIFLYLVTARRFCYFCLINKVDFFPMTLPQAAKALHRSKAKVIADRRLPRVHALAGRYTASLKQAKNRVLLFDRPAVRQACQAAGLPEALCRPKLDLSTAEVARHMAVITAPYFGPTPQTVDFGFHCVLCKESTDWLTFFRIPYTRGGLLKHIQDHHGIE